MDEPFSGIYYCEWYCQECRLRNVRSTWIAPHALVEAEGNGGEGPITLHCEFCGHPVEASVSDFQPLEEAKR